MPQTELRAFLPSAVIVKERDGQAGTGIGEMVRSALYCPMKTAGLKYNALVPEAGVGTSLIERQG